MPHRSLVGWVYHDRRESGPEGCFLCQTFFSSKRPCFDRERNISNFQIARAFSGERGLWCGERGSRVALQLADALAAQRRRAWRARTRVVARARSAQAPQRQRGPQASRLLDATGSLSARSRPVRRSRGAARAEMVAMAQAGSPPGDGLAARRRHRWLSASAPDSGNATHPAVKLQLCACAAAQSRTAVKSHDQHGSRRRAPARRFTLLFSAVTLRTACEL